ncbi:hypothetical protein AVEN_240985-1 [Araneus ventricosus]|uniref:Uncharacterized protein n=1 Tax=Araneus ventricosus TaxID=182803 RepID=A0A4Y2SKC4_ARAVE|nr:hypothetical protein AVEN_240985-1 [Araneus ventricosus]
MVHQHLVTLLRFGCEPECERVFQKKIPVTAGFKPSALPGLIVEFLQTLTETQRWKNVETTRDSKLTEENSPSCPPGVLCTFCFSLGFSTVTLLCGFDPSFTNFCKTN